MEDSLPRGWHTATLREVVSKFESVDPRSTPSKQFRYVDIGSIDNQTHEVGEPKTFPGSEAPSRARRVVKEHDVLFSTVRPYLKNIASVPADLDGELTSTGICILRPTPAVDSAFLLQSVLREEFVKAVSSSMDGTMYPAVRDADVLEQTIPLPPLNEQRRIVAKLEELSTRTRSARAALDAIPPLLDRFRQSVLAAAFRGDLTADWRAKNPDVEPASELLKRIRQERRRRWEEAELEKLRAKGKAPKDDRWKAKYVEPEGVDAEGLPELPEGWAWCRGRELFSWSNGKSLTAENRIPGPYPIYGGNGVSGHHVDCNMGRPTLVIGRVGANCGNVYITDGPAWVTDNAMYATYLPAAINLQFFHYSFLAAHLNSRAGGSGQPFVSQGILDSLLFSVPPFEEEVEIVGRVGAAWAFADSVETGTRNSRGLMDTLDASLLARAFRGELVPQDSADESASVLLERIRAEREESGSNGKPKRGRKAKGKA